jgi:hypothetical protein
MTYGWLTHPELPSLFAVGKRARQQRELLGGWAEQLGILPTAGHILAICWR